MRVLGFMSGTSLDGVDAAVIDTDGERVNAFGPAAMIPFSAEERDTLARAVSDALRLEDPFGVAVSFGPAIQVLHRAHVRAAETVLAQSDRPVDLMGFHGQTVLHRPEIRLSVQLGEPGALARALGAPVVADFRQADLQAGGQGAPIVPVYHQALAEKLGLSRPAAFLNIGGVANLSWLGRDGEMMAFDTGPGNGLIDQLVAARGLGAYDANGALAAAGVADEAVLTRLLSLPFFARSGPKSADRYDFPADAVDHLGAEDAAATLTVFTARSIAVAARRLPEPPETWLVCGGGRRNPTLMRALNQALGDCRSVDDYGLRGDFIEAEAMAFLAARSRRGLPLTFPGTTGVAAPVSGGRLWV